MDNGWIKLYRKIQDNPIKRKPLVMALWIDLLLKANHKKNSFAWNCEVISVDRGQVLTGRKQLSADTGLSEQNVRTALNTLKSTNKITIKTYSKFSIITINNYNIYQDTNQQTNQQLTSNQPATNQQLTTNKNDNNEKNEKNETTTTNNSDDDGIKKIIEVYNTNIHLITPVIVQSIQSYLPDTPIEWIIKAIEVASKNNARKWNYIEAIIKKWKEKGRIDIDERKELSYAERRAKADAHEKRLREEGLL